MKTIRQAIIGATALLFAFAIHMHGQNALQFTATRVTDEGAIHLEWASQSNHVYQVQCADSLIDTNTGTITWQMLYDNYPSQGTNTFWLDCGNYFQTPPIPHPGKSPARFYQIFDKGPDDLVGDEPTVSITSPANGFVASGLLTVSVTASTDQGSVDHRLYVDGQEMWPSGDGTNYVINTCEWGNGPHVLFATVRSSTAVDGPEDSYGFTGYAVSPMVPVVFSNLVTRISFSQVFFRPALGQTQQVSAVFAANSDWTLAIKDIYTNTVRTATGSGISMQFNWDGTGNGGTNIPDGVYYYYLSAQTNGQAFQAQSSGSPAGSGSPPLPSLASGNSSLETALTELLAVPADGSGAVVPLILYPPGTDTNGLVIFEGSMADFLPRAARSTAIRSLSPMDSGNGGAAADYSGPSAQAAPAAPTRAATTPSKGTGGKFAVAYQMYNANGTNGVLAAPILDNNFGVHTYVQMRGNPGNRSIPYAPFRKADLLAGSFVTGMMAGDWDVSNIRPDDKLLISDLRGSGTFFNNADLGLLLVHGTYGTSFDTTPGHQVKQMYFPIASGGGAQYLRMSEMSLGGSSPTNGLKWMAIMGCFSLYPQNWTSMKNQGVKPYNGNLHMILGCATDFAAEPIIGQYWADYMLGIDPKTRQPVQPMKIRDAWYAAANNAYRDLRILGAPNPTVLAVVADGNCSEDSLQTNSVPSGGTWSYSNSKTVYPWQ
jgi:Family of unknown function (DUF6345)/FlgD Ig-like domain/Bacterial Ig domain